MSGRNRKHGRRLKRRRMRVCVWCGTPLSRTEATVEHLVPKSMGGPDEVWNLAWSCLDCNCRRGNNVHSPEVRATLAEAFRGRLVPVVWRAKVSTITGGRYDGAKENRPCDHDRRRACS